MCNNPMKDHIKDIILIAVAIGYNYIFAFIGFLFLTVLNQVIISLNFNNSYFDHLIGNLTILSFEGLTFLLFLYFVLIDLKTILSDNRVLKEEYEELESHSSKGKLLINKAFNTFCKLPFENSIRHAFQIYLLRILLITTVLLPLYISQVGIYFLTIAPMTTAILSLVILLGAALLYQFDTKMGKLIEQYVLKYKELLTPENIEVIKGKLRT